MVVLFVLCLLVLIVHNTANVIKRTNSTAELDATTGTRFVLPFFLHEADEHKFWFPATLTLNLVQLMLVFIYKKIKNQHILTCFMEKKMLHILFWEKSLHLKLIRDINRCD